MQTVGACVLASAVSPTTTMHLAIPSGHRKRPGVPSRRPRKTVPPATTEVQHQNVQTKRASAGRINKRAAPFVYVVVGFVSASNHYRYWCTFSDPRLKWGVIRVFRAVSRKCAQIDGLSKPVRMVPEPLRYDQSSNYAPCQTAIVRNSEPRLANLATSTDPGEYLRSSTTADKNASGRSREPWSAAS
jgi:hypothetical protein